MLEQKPSAADNVDSRHEQTGWSTNRKGRIATILGTLEV